MNNVTIIPFAPKYANDFRKISYEWLEKYVTVLPEDEELLQDPQGAIIDQGGFIFFAKYEQHIVGTVSILKVDHDTVELAKLGVTEDYKGLKIGKALMEYSIQKAIELNMKRMILYTNENLETALRMYEKYGFKKVSGQISKYIETDFKMELHLC
ncbi:GNAT family N-acetyltransferase [Salirhabdus salicampi]|uniref:GNAT family N-acetyltransferase n=1 Tax=Salirhabdus salicampi TaxID=476102 RepID=UPI0020C43428|nr:GNAT family N-acetyltransferase [Salirhabdus salicampi]MCP8615426.1 GNAT family N-acetyltransferase [Salirhabdus salicampi]